MSNALLPFWYKSRSKWEIYANRIITSFEHHQHPFLKGNLFLMVRIQKIISIYIHPIFSTVIALKNDPWRHGYLVSYLTPGYILYAYVTGTFLNHF